MEGEGMDWCENCGLPEHPDPAIHHVQIGEHSCILAKDVGGL